MHELAVCFMIVHNNIFLHFFVQQRFRACLEAERQRELVLLALRRTVSSKSKSLLVHGQKALHISSSEESISTSSFVSIKDAVSGQDSGFNTSDMENVKFSSELHDMARTIENLRGTIEKKEQDLLGSKQKCKMLDDHRSLLALHAHELSERRELLEDELEWRGKELDTVTMKHNETIRRMKEDNTREKRRNALQLKKLEAAVAALEEKNAELKKELEERILLNKVNDIVNVLICKSAHESVNKDLAECLKKNTSLEDELALMKTQIVDKESQMIESMRLLEESREKCKLYEEKMSLLTVQMDEASTTIGRLENEVFFMQKEINSMKMWNTDEESRRLADDAQDNVYKELLRNSVLEEEISKCRMSQLELEENVKEEEVLLLSG